jgi:hypothetical protein
MVPICGLIVQFTPVPGAPETVAVNCADWLVVRVAVVGEIVTAVAVKVTVALADFVLSSTLAAVIVTFALLENVPEGGAVYVAEFPFGDKVPRAGELLIDQTTPFDPPFTVAVNTWVNPAVSVADPGEMLTETGVRLMVALPDTVLSDTSVAVSLMDCDPLMGFGGV